MNLYVQRRRTRGWRMPKGGISCTRPGILGNPFWVLPGEDPKVCVDLYRAWIARRGSGDAYHEQRMQVRQRLPDLRGKILLCWCKPGVPCHVQDVLLPLANSKPIHDCDGYCGGAFQCCRCLRVVGDCLGADDKIDRTVGPTCDDCAAKRAA